MGDLKDSIVEWGIVLFISLFGGAARMSLCPKDKEAKQSPGRYFSDLVVAAFSGLIVYNLSLYWLSDGSSTLVVALVGMGGLLGADLCRALMGLADKARRDPLAVMDYLRRGRPGDGGNG